MNKLKSAIARLKEYLHNDMQGVRLLGDVDEVANKMRKELSQERERCRELLEQKTLTQSRAFTAEEKLKKTQEEVRRLTDAVGQCKREIDSLVDELSAIKTPEDGMADIHSKQADYSDAALLGILDRLRAKWRVCPKPAAFVEQFIDNLDLVGDGPVDHKSATEDTFYVYHLQDLINGFSGAEMMSLGLFVSAMAMTNYPCLVTSATTVKDTKRDIHDVSDNSQPLAVFIRWFRTNFKDTRMKNGKDIKQYIRNYKPFSLDHEQHAWREVDGLMMRVVGGDLLLD